MRKLNDALRNLIKKKPNTKPKADNTTAIRGCVACRTTTTEKSQIKGAPYVCPSCGRAL